MSDGPFITIGIPTYNRIGSVTRRVEELLALPLPADVRLLVIDNASEDGTYESLSGQFGDRVRVLRNDSNLGYAGNILRLVEEAEGQYLLVLSDEDRLEFEGFARLADLCRAQNPVMVSPRAQTGTNPNYRGSAVTRPILPEEFESASFYISGLTFSLDSARAATPAIRGLVPDNSAATVYPQVLLAALVLARGEGYFSDALVSVQEEVQPTTITEPSGIQYNSVVGRWFQFRGFEQFFALDHLDLTPESAARLASMRAAIRKGILGLLVTAAGLEFPELQPILRAPARRSIGGRTADLFARLRGTRG